MNLLNDIIKSSNVKLYIYNKIDTFCFTSDILCKYWDNDPLVKAGNVYNGTILNLKKFTFHNDELTIYCNHVEYKYFYISRKHPSLKLPIQALGISGIILSSIEGSEHTLFAQRSNKVAHYPGFYELVPSGHLDTLNTNPDGTLNYKEKLFEELEEETNLPRTAIQTVQECGFIYDRQLDVYDIVCKMPVNLTYQQLADIRVNPEEYTLSQVVSSVDIPSFLKKEADKIIPTSKALASLIFNIQE